ncbi:MAG: ABC transporter ATP-binding protein [Anaerolineae bacterium]|nr:ABC transporter ATP-binding protein [Anaerolineae bacterium]MDW8172175.1 ABC transporter ATP-binding protein [Anaerolineae bacterium]
MTLVIATHGLSKVYRSGQVTTQALSDLNLQVYQGEIFGYLGPNGAGKTTTIRLLLDLIRPSSGTAQLFGLDSRRDSLAIRARIGYIPGELNLWKNRLASQVVRHMARLRGDEARIWAEAQHLAERLKLDMSKRIRDYSTGNKRKLGLVLALMHRPELVILDEPTSGLDPLMQQTFNHMMLEIKAEGRTVFLSSHVLSEVQAICDRVGIIRDGRLRAVEAVDKLVQVGYRDVRLEFREPVPSSWVESLARQAPVSAVKVEGSSLNLRLHGDFDPLLRAFNGAYIRNVHINEPSLEEIFLAFYSDEQK